MILFHEYFFSIASSPPPLQGVHAHVTSRCNESRTHNIFSRVPFLSTLVGYQVKFLVKIIKKTVKLVY